jgi:integral membrane protein
MDDPVLAINHLRRIGMIEGASFLILLGVAMPLKYFAGLPVAVQVMGWAHGLLFIIFCLALLRAKRSARWSIAESAVVFVAALLPFGPFLIDARLRRQANGF